jgi:hypothetical protein
MKTQDPQGYDAQPQQGWHLMGSNKNKPNYPAKPGTPHPHDADLPKAQQPDVLETPAVSPGVQNNRQRDIATL